MKYNLIKISCLPIPCLGSRVLHGYKVLQIKLHLHIERSILYSHQLIITNMLIMEVKVYHINMKRNKLFIEKTDILHTIFALFSKSNSFILIHNNIRNINVCVVVIDCYLKGIRM